VTHFLGVFVDKVPGSFRVVENRSELDPVHCRGFGSSCCFCLGTKTAAGGTVDEQQRNHKESVHGDGAWVCLNALAMSVSAMELCVSVLWLFSR
jgi:hypothetical protein